MTKVTIINNGVPVHSFSAESIMFKDYDSISLDKAAVVLTEKVGNAVSFISKMK